MKLKLYFIEMWRTILFFLIGYGCIVATVFLAARVSSPKSFHGNLVYACLLGLVALMAFLMVEYSFRRRFYLEALIRLQQPASLSQAPTMTAAGTAEQRLFIQLLHRYHTEYIRELEVLSAEQSLHEMFATRFAHQMKTPITVIQLLEEELREKYKSSPDILDFLSSLSEERIRMETTVGIMLNAARLTSFSSDAHMEDVLLLDVIREVVNEHKSEWIHRAIYPKIECATPSLTVKSDRKWLLFVIDQIVRNALQYGYPVDETGMAMDVPTTFLIRVSETQDAVEIAFSDQGIGIPLRDVQHVFQPFYTGANGRSHSRATGMGLYLVKEVLNRLGHQIQLDSVEGKGTIVVITMASSDYLSPAYTDCNVTKM